MVRGREVISAGRKVYMANLEMQNAFWGVKLPPALRRIFVVKGVRRGARRCVCLLCHLPNRGMGNHGRCGEEGEGKLLGTHSRYSPTGVHNGGVAVHGAAREETRAVCGFIVGDKSEPQPVEKIKFIGNYVDAKTGRKSNTVGGIVGSLRVSVRGVGRKKVPSKSLSRMLGQL